MFIMPLTQFETFLSTVDLAAYRTRYLPIKIVEMDLPPQVQALDQLYGVYWTRREFPSYDDFYEGYKQAKQQVIEEFRIKTTLCADCFYRGLPARIYRTWASIITQIHAGYVAESVFGEGTVTMSEELDHQGADFQVTYGNRTLNYQVKKTSFSREVRQDRPRARQPLPGEFIEISYKVPIYDHIRQPYQLNGREFYSDYRQFKETYLDTGMLKVWPNGFVVFTPLVFVQKKGEIDNTL